MLNKNWKEAQGLLTSLRVLRVLVDHKDSILDKRCHHKDFCLPGKLKEYRVCVYVSNRRASAPCVILVGNLLNFSSSSSVWTEESVRSRYEYQWHNRIVEN